MKIALFGYGKMGKTIEQIAIARGHQISFKIDVSNQAEIEKIHKSNTDVIIEFSSPDAAFENLCAAMKKGIPTVCGTTGWLEQRDQIEKLCYANSAAFFYASNYSIGVNLFFHLNKKLAKIMDTYDEYKASIDEVHHIQKLDAPSGTAITLAEGIIENTDILDAWVCDKPTFLENELPITSFREGAVPGTHVVRYQSPIDKIEIKHEAFGREGFATGAIVAAEWLKNQKGVFGMTDLLRF